MPAAADPHPSTARVAVFADGNAEPALARATALAKQLSLPLQTSPHTACDLLLTVTPERLELRGGQPGAPGPIYVDFVGGPLGYQFRTGQFGLLRRAVGARGEHPTIIDATAGLGRDAFRLACCGCSVLAIERSPLLATLLQDGLTRAALVPAVQEVLGDRLQVICADARDVLAHLNHNQAPDVIYLDPMFPPKKKTALVRKEMRILRQLVGDDADAGELFESARAVARQRVVVKRMRLAPPLAPNPTRTYSDKTTRYDVYLRF